MRSIALYAAFLGALTSSATAQCEVLVQTRPSPAVADAFGWSVAVDGPVIAIGAIQGDLGCAGGANCNAGDVIVLEETAPGVFTSQQVVASDGTDNDQFGQHVSVSGNMIAVGAHLADEGKVYMFSRDATGWSEQAVLQAAGIGPFFHFGHSLELDEETLLVGCMLDNHAGQNAGSAFIFEHDGGVWTETAKLVASDAGPMELFGRATDLHADIALVGCHQDDGTALDAGAAYVFARDDNGTALDRTDDLWPQDAKLSPAQLGPGAGFGLGLATFDGEVFVGAPGDLDGGVATGSLYIFERGLSGWTQTQRIVPSDVEDGDRFGESVAVDGGRMLVGAPGDADGGPASGAVYVFERGAAGWVETTKYVPSDAGPSDLTGREMSVALHGDRAVIGSPTRSSTLMQAGAATVLDLASCLGEPACTATPNSTGAIGTAFGSGSLLAEANDLRIHAADLPLSVFGLFVVSRTPDFVPLVAGGQGNLCIGGDVGRYNNFIQSTGPTGTASFPVDLTAINAPSTTYEVISGDELYFQFWHRDVVSAAQTSNLTASVRLRFR